MKHIGSFIVAIALSAIFGAALFYLNRSSGVPEAEFMVCRITGIIRDVVPIETFRGSYVRAHASPRDVMIVNVESIEQLIPEVKPSDTIFIGIGGPTPGQIMKEDMAGTRAVLTLTRRMQTDEVVVRLKRIDRRGIAQPGATDNPEGAQ